MPITLVIADDHPLILDAMETLFSLQKEFKIVAQCGTSDEAIEAVRKHRPDILLLDICMPGKSVFEVIREMQKDKLPTRVVLLTAVIDENQMLEATRLGVYGVVLKEIAPKLLVQCVRQVHAGKKWFAEAASRSALEKMVRREGAAREASQVLSPRQMEILRMVASGLGNKEIGKKLFISEGTVKVHLHAIYEKLQLRSRLALSLYARDKGLV